MPSVSPKMAKVLRSYRTGFVKKAQKIITNARNSTAKHGMEFNEKVAASINVVKSISGFANTLKFDVIVMG